MSTIDLLPDVTVPEPDPNTKRHYDTLVHVQMLANVICPRRKPETFDSWWEAILRKAEVWGDYDAHNPYKNSEDLKWAQLFDVWLWLLSESADRQARGHAWAQKHYGNKEPSVIYTKKGEVLE